MPGSSASPRALWLCVLIAACDANPAHVLTGPQHRSVAGAAALPEPDRLGVRLVVSGPANPCESCAEIVAEVTGGSAPYTYVWSEPSLTGPGPHRVCPRRTTAMLVVVTDATGTTSGGATALTCPLADQPAQAPATAPVCTASLPLDLSTVCEASLASVPKVLSNALSPALLPGTRYRATLDLQSIQLSIAAGLTVEVYGAPGPCERGPLLGTMRLQPDQSHYEFCFSVDRPYTFVALAQAEGTASLGLPVAQSLVFCTGCAE